MFVELAVVGLITIAGGAIFCFAGYRLFRIIIVVWGFFIGLLIGAHAVASLVGGAFLATPLAWGAGLALGIFLAGLAYLLYSAGIAILGATVGYLVGLGLMTVLGFDAQAGLTFVAGVLVAILFGVLILLLDLAKFLIMLITAMGGASAIVLGVLLFLRLIPLNFLDTGLPGAFLQGSPLWEIVWLAVAAIGFLFQLQGTRNYQVERYALPSRMQETRS